MNKRIFEGLCVSIFGQYVNYLRLQKMLESLLSDVDGLTVLKQYQQDTGRKYPPSYRVKIIMETEQVSDEESEEFWRNLEQ